MKVFILIFMMCFLVIGATKTDTVTTTVSKSDTIANTGGISTGRLTTSGKVKVNSLLTVTPDGANYNEGIRIAPSTNGGYSVISLGARGDTTEGKITGQWGVLRAPASLGYYWGLDYNGRRPFVVDTTGRTGIRTTSPQYPLHVVGNPDTNTAYFVGSGTTGKSFGPKIQAGTNSSDQAFGVYGYGNTPYLTVRGDGVQVCWNGLGVAKELTADSISIGSSHFIKSFYNGSFPCTLSTTYVTVEVVATCYYYVINGYKTIIFPTMGGTSNGSGAFILRFGSIPSVLTSGDQYAHGTLYANNAGTPEIGLAQLDKSAKNMNVSRQSGVSWTTSGYKMVNSSSISYY